MTTNISAVLETRGRVKELERLWNYGDAILFWGFIGFVISILVAFIIIIATNGQWLLALSAPAVLSIVVTCGLATKKDAQKHINELKQGALKALEALERNLPNMLTRAADGAQGYTSDLAYKLLSKWLKLEHSDGNHAHLREYVLATQIGLALIALHHPSLMCLGEDGLPEGRFSFENVRDMGPCSLKWKLSEDGKFTLRLDHPNPKGGAGWGTVIA